MHKIFFYQTHLTEGQWSYINKVFFENDCRHRKYSLRSIFEADYYMEHPEYDGLIYITDGYAPDPDIPAEYRRLPVTWIITDDDLIPSIRHGWN